MVRAHDLPWQHDERKPLYSRAREEILQLDFEDYKYWTKLQSTNEVRRSVDLYLRDLPLDKINVRSVSPFMYNCVGLIFASRRAWIEIDELRQILREDKYRPIAFDEICCGDIVIYSKNSRRIHVGLVTSVQRNGSRIGPVKVLSKWGRSAEVEHDISVVPRDYGTHNEYWSERVPYGIA